ncbi:MAG: D-alanyl-D-alanine carboxypeptidase family protein [Bacillota bacterium]|jgi:D-alanyl-D-alanine carboxypeptidase (penicillin-binding protein 5/6)
MKVGKIAVIFIVLTIFLLPLSAAYANEGDLDIDAQACMLLDGVNGDIIYQKDADKKCFPASVTKIMTLVLILEALDAQQINLADQVTTSREAASMGGSQVYLFEGEKRSVDDMIIAIAVGSGNDASVAMAEYIGGSTQGFVKMMNEKAKKLGMDNTNFVNPHGLHDDNHYTTAADMAKLALYAVKVPKFLEYTSIYEYDFRIDPKPLKLWNTNRLLKWYDGCDGMKTGYTPESKRNLVSTAKRDGLRLISVVLGVEEPQGHFTESMKLLNYGFNKYEFKSLYAANSVIGQTKVGKGTKNQVDLIVGNEVGLLVQKGQDPAVSIQLKAPSYIEAPLKAGAKAGELQLVKDGKVLSTYQLLIKEDVAKGNVIRTWSKFLTAWQ